MSKEKTLKTNQGILEIWEHEVGPHDISIEQKYGTRIFNKKTCGTVLKVHASAKALEVYIEDLNLIVPVKE